LFPKWFGNFIKQKTQTPTNKGLAFLKCG